MIPCGPDSDSPNPRTHNGQKARKSNRDSGSPAGQKNLTMLAARLVRATREPSLVTQGAANSDEVPVA